MHTMQVEAALRQRSVPNDPAILPGTWYALAIASAVFAAIGVSIAAVYVFADGFDPVGDPALVQTLAPFGVAVFGLVTFLTVAWRGSLATQQLIQAERESRAKLLQEGAKLLGDDAKPSHVSAGLASLGILVTGEDEAFAKQAMNLVASFIQQEMRSSHEHPHLSEAFAIMEAGASLGRNANRTVTFTDDLGHKARWKLLQGVDVVHYVGGVFQAANINMDPKKVKFKNVRFERCVIETLHEGFEECVYSGCKIKAVTLRLRSIWLQYEDPSIFESCDFSGAAISDLNRIRDLRPGKSYYDTRNPPVLIEGGPVDWSEFLIPQVVETIKVRVPS